MKSFGLPHYFVNTINLGLFVTDRVFYHKGLGPAVDLTISYNSLANASGMFGNKWIFSYEGLIMQGENKLDLFSASGKVTSFKRVSVDENTTGWQALEGCFDTLEEHDGFWCYFSKDDRLRFFYNKAPGKDESRLSAIADQNENTVRLEYQTDGKIYKLIDAVGREIVFDYYEGGGCRSFSLQDGRTATFEYDLNGDLIKTIDFAGILSTYQYDTEGYLRTMSVGRKKRTTQFSYLDHGNFKTLASITDAKGHQTTYEVASLDPRMIKVTHPEGNTTLYQSNNGLTERITDALGNYSSTQYDNGKPILFRDKRGNETSYAYDWRGNLIKIFYPDNRLYQLEYDDEDRLVKVIDPSANQTVFAYDNKGNLTKTLTPSGIDIKYYYDGKGQLIKILKTGGFKISLAYDFLGNLVSVENSDGIKEKLTYDSYGYRLTEITDDHGNTYRYDYDANNRVTFTNNPDGSSVKRVYDCCSGIQTIDEIGNRISYERDALSNITGLIDKIGGKTKFFYNDNNWLIKMVDPINRVLSFKPNAVGLITSIVDPSGHQSYFDYDQAGNLVSYKDAKDKTIRYEYNNNNEMIKSTNFMEGTIHYHRDPLGRIKTIVNARGNQIEYSYDAEGRILEKKFDKKIVAAQVIDDDKNLIELEDSRGTTLIRFNRTYQPVEITYPDSSRVTFTYSKTANLEKMTYGDHLSINYVYDNRDRVISIKWQDHFINLTYDSADNLLKETRSNGTHTDYRVNAKHMILGLSHNRGDDLFAGIELKRDTVDRITKAVIHSPLNLPEDLQPYQRSVEMDYANQALSINGAEFSFDLDGNMTSEKDWAAKFDAENRPIEISRHGQTSQYEYDLHGYRVSETVEGIRTNFHYDLAGRLLYESNQKDEIITVYIYCGRQLMAKVVNHTGVFFYHYDAMGNTMAITDSKGALAAAYDYEPYGKIRARLDEVTHNRFTFGGAYGVMDEGDGLYAFERRFYHSDSGRFIQSDPLGLAGGGNDYAFAAGNPLLYIDPEGTAVITGSLILLTGIGILVGGGTAYYQKKKADAAFQQRCQASKLAARRLERFESYTRSGKTEPEIQEEIIKFQGEMQENLVTMIDSNLNSAKTVAETAFDAVAPPLTGEIRAGVNWGYDKYKTNVKETTPKPTDTQKNKPGKNPCPPPSAGTARRQNQLPKVDLPDELEWDSLDERF